MAKLRKRPKSHAESPRSSKFNLKTTDATRSPLLPVINERPAPDSRELQHATNHERRRSDNLARDVFQGREMVNASISNRTNATSPISPLVRTEQRTVTKAERKPSPLRVSQEASAESEIVVAGPSKPNPGYRREKCGPSCQKCGRPRKPFLPDASNGETRPAPATNGPLSGPANEVLVPTIPQNAVEKAIVPDTAQPKSTAVPSSDQRSRRRKYFSLPTKSKPSFKGPTELASVTGKLVEPLRNTELSDERPRPVSAPSPTKSSFRGLRDTGSPNPRPTAGACVHFATDDHLGRFAGIIKAPETTTSARLQALRSLTPGPTNPTTTQHGDRAVSKVPTSNPHLAAQPHPQALIAAQPNLRPNSAVLYEWPLATTLVNQPNSNLSTRHPNVKIVPSRSSLSISKRPSRRTSRPYSNPHIHAPTPARRTSSRYKTLLRQSHKVSYIVDNASNSSHDSISIQILDMLQGFPGGELAATAKTQTNAKPLSERPSLLRLQTYPTDIATENFKLSINAPEDEINGGIYSPSEYGSEEDDNYDDHPMPVTPPQSDFSLASYSIDDKKLNLRPVSTLTQASFSIGDDKRLPLKKISHTELVSAPSSAESSPDLATAESPPSVPSTSLPLALPLTIAPSADSEGMIPVSRLSVVNLPEVVSTGSGSVEEEMDPDWFSWGALPGSYGGAGMWSGDPSPGPETGGRAELGVAS